MKDIDHTPTRCRATTRARLLQAAVGVFAEKGLGATTVDDIAGAAGYTRGAFYSNFSTKEDVFYELFELQSQHMVDLVREAVESTPTENFHVDLVATVLEQLRPHARLWYLIQTEYLLLAMRNTEAGQRFLEHRVRIEDEFAEVILEALNRHGRRPTIPILQLADVLMSLYLKNLAAETLADPERGASGGRSFLDKTLPAVIFGLSEPLPPTP